jgi:hypothetical protein
MNVKAIQSRADPRSAWVPPDPLLVLKPASSNPEELDEGVGCGPGVLPT